MTARIREVRKIRRERNKKSIKFATAIFCLIAAAVFLLMAVIQHKI